MSPMGLSSTSGHPRPFRLGTVRPAPSHSRAVAVVDDDWAMRDAIRMTLEGAGCFVATYASAEHFIAAGMPGFRNLIVDYSMPGMNGLELVSCLAGKATRRRVMLITGSFTAAIGAWAADLGVTRVLQKPRIRDGILAFVTSAELPGATSDFQPARLAAL